MKKFIKSFVKVVFVVVIALLSTIGTLSVIDLVYHADEAPKKEPMHVIEIGGCDKKPRWFVLRQGKVTVVMSYGEAKRLGIDEAIAQTRRLIVYPSRDMCPI